MRPAYLARRDANYYFRKRLRRPGAYRRHVGPTHVRVSLRTADKRVAMRRLMMTFDVVHRFETHDDLVERANVLIKEMDRLGPLGPSPTTDALVERRTIEALGGALIVEARLRHHDLVNHPKDFYPTWNAFIDDVCRADRNLHTLERRSYERGRSEMNEAIVEGWTTPSVAIAPKSEVPPTADQRQSFAAFEAAALIDASQEAQTAEPRLSELVARYLDEVRITDGNSTNVDEAKLPLNFVIDFLNDPTLTELSSAALGQVEQALTRVPTPANIPAEHKRSLHARYRYAETHGREGLKRISSKTLRNRWHRRLHLVFDWAIAKRHMEGPRYAFTLVGADNPEEQLRDAWTMDEVTRFFSSPLFLGSKSEARLLESGTTIIQGASYWAYLLVFFLGLRPSEICRLKPTSFFERDGIHYIDLRDGTSSARRRRKRSHTKGKSKTSKTKAGERIVPVPQFILDLGLLDHVHKIRESSATRLFPDWRVYVSKSGRSLYSHYLTKQFARMRHKLGLPPDLVLYGGRHTRASWLDEAGVAQRTRIRTLGHEDQSVADNYGALDLTDAEAREVLKAYPSELTDLATTLLKAVAAAECVVKVTKAPSGDTEELSSGAEGADDE